MRAVLGRLLPQPHFGFQGHAAGFVHTALHLGDEGSRRMVENIDAPVEELVGVLSSVNSS